MGVKGRSAGKVRAKASPFVRSLKRFFVVFLTLALFGIAGFFAFLYSSVQAVESDVAHMGEKLQKFNSTPSRIYSADGVLLYEIRPVYRANIVLNEVPKYVQNAVLAAEDKRFFEHPGVDSMGLARAVVGAALGNSKSGGGSTINMQLSKRLFSDSERTMSRKIRDISIAFQMEKKYTKEEILQMYLNQVYYGEQAYGIAAASEIYFGKTVKELTIGEAAMIARCVQSPTNVNPVRNYQESIRKRNSVLEVMLSEGWITQKQYSVAIEERPKIVKNGRNQHVKVYHANYFVASVLRELREKEIKVQEGGYTIRTTLDMALQGRAENSAEQVIRWNRGKGVNVMAFLACDSQGQILVDVGGRDFSKNQFSYTRQSKLQPGSSFKTFVYAEALKNGVVGEYSRISNEKLVIPNGSRNPYIPRNSHGGYGGDASLFTAFTQSMNVPAVRTFRSLGVAKGTKAIQSDFGFETKLDPVPALALGSTDVRPIEMAEAYSVFMLDGKRIKPYSIKSIVGPDGGTIFTGAMSFSNTQISPEVCRVMDKLLRGVVTDGTGKSAGGVPDAHGKTGTTNKGKSVWFCGYAKGIVGISWAGSQFYDKKRKYWRLSEMPESYGGDIAAPLWAQIMGDAVNKFGSDAKPKFGIPTPDDVDQEQPKRRRRRRDDEGSNDVVVERVPAVVDATDDSTASVDDETTARKPRKRDPENEAPAERDPDKQPSEPKETEPVRAPKGQATEPDRPRRNEARKKPEPTRDEEVEVEVCADSGRLATRYCPETITRKYPKSKRPKGRCPLHKPPSEGGDGDGKH
jgi:penicillin-binding protein 1A